MALHTAFCERARAPNRQASPTNAQSSPLAHFLTFPFSRQFVMSLYCLNSGWPPEWAGNRSFEMVKGNQMIQIVAPTKLASSKRADGKSCMLNERYLSISSLFSLLSAKLCSVQLCSTRLGSATFRLSSWNLRFLMDERHQEQPTLSSAQPSSLLASNNWPPPPPPPPQPLLRFAPPTWKAETTQMLINSDLCNTLALNSPPLTPSPSFPLPRPSEPI